MRPETPPSFVEFAAMRTVLAGAVRAAGSQAAWCALHGITRSEVCETLSGRRDASERIVNALGFVVRQVCVPISIRSPSPPRASLATRRADAQEPAHA